MKEIKLSENFSSLSSLFLQFFKENQGHDKKLDRKLLAAIKNGIKIKALDLDKLLSSYFIHSLTYGDLHTKIVSLRDTIYVGVEEQDEDERLYNIFDQSLFLTLKHFINSPHFTYDRFKKTFLEKTIHYSASDLFLKGIIIEWREEKIELKEGEILEMQELYTEISKEIKGEKPLFYPNDLARLFLLLEGQVTKTLQEDLHNFRPCTEEDSKKKSSPCIICQEKTKRSSLLKSNSCDCKHTFYCKQCLVQLKRSNKDSACPTCRKPEIKEDES